LEVRVPPKLNARLIGIELYFDDLETGKRFYSETLGFRVRDEHQGRYARYDTQPAFVCLERKGSESYPSRDKAVIFLEVPDVVAAVDAIGRSHVVEMHAGGAGNRRPWAALHDPEGHNIVLVQAGTSVDE
jgi:predicted enzyme related to lactoylglutathione lyase